jgi:hypothetical protein
MQSPDWVSWVDCQLALIQDCFERERPAAASIMVEGLADGLEQVHGAALEDAVRQLRSAARKATHSSMPAARVCYEAALPMIRRAYPSPAGVEASSSSA